MDATQQALEAITRFNDTLRQRMQQTETKSSEQDQQLSTNKATLATLALWRQNVVTELAKIEDTLLDLREDVDPLDPRILALEGAVSTINKTLTSFNTSLTALQSDNTTNKDNISKLQTAVSTNQTNIKSLQTDNATNKNNISANATDIAALKTTDATHTSDIATLKAGTKANADDITALKTTTATHSSDITSMKQTDVTQSADIASLKAVLSVTGWTTMTLSNRWAAQSTAEAPSYRKSHGYVELNGTMITGTSGSTTVVATLPIGFRPAELIRVPIAYSYTSNLRTVYGSFLLEIATTGVITIYAPASSYTAVFLDGVRFLAA